MTKIFYMFVNLGLMWLNMCMSVIFDYLNANIVAVMLFFTMIFALASKSRRFRNFILPTYLISMISSIGMIYLDARGFIKLTNDSYLIFYHLVFVSFTFIENLNVFVNVAMSNILSLIVVLKILYTGDTSHLIIQLLGFSIDYFKTELIRHINIKKQKELVFNFNFDLNKNLHTFNEQKVVFNC